MIRVIDNYDSFTFNLVQYLRMLGAEVLVARNDRIDVAAVVTEKPDAVVLSPGPGTPDDAGICVELVRRLAGRVPILGVCLGHQCLAAAYGGLVTNAQRIMHGKVSLIEHDGQGVYSAIRSPLKAVRYHSLVVEPERVPPELMVTARDEIGEIMGLRHIRYPLEGIQFHPESVLTPCGKRLLRNFLKNAACAADLQDAGGCGQ